MYVPDFLDPDAFEGIILDAPHAFQVDRPLRNDENVYWTAERQRTLLRLVCKSWNDHCNLPRFQHRFVQMKDIWHNKIGEVSLKTAIRVNFYLGGCLCVERCMKAFLDDSGAFHRRYKAFCFHIIASVGPTRMEIVDFSALNVDDLAGFVDFQNMKNVKTLVSTGSSYNSLTVLSREMQCLTHFHTNAPFWITGPLTSLRSSSLVSLCFHSIGVAKCEGVVWHLPSLLHLGVVYNGHFSSVTFLHDFLVPILHMVGSRLRSLYVSGGRFEHKIPSTIWDMCPELERIHAPLDMDAPPPDFHPLRTVSLSYLDFKTASILEMAAPIFTWPNLRKVIVNTEWDWIGVNESLEFWTRKLEIWSRLGIRLEDRNGDTFDSFIQSIRKD